MNMSTKRDIALVVDDSPETLKVLTDALEESGIMVVVAQSGEKGLELAGRVRPDIILMDAIMPGMNGFELAELAIRKNPSIKILISSGFTGNTSKIIKQNRNEFPMLRKP